MINIWGSHFPILPNTYTAIITTKLLICNPFHSQNVWLAETSILNVTHNP